MVTVDVYFLLSPLLYLYAHSQVILASHLYFRHFNCNMLGVHEVGSLAYCTVRI